MTPQPPTTATAPQPPTTATAPQPPTTATAPLPPTRRVSAFAHYRILLGKDLRREFRTREMLSSMGIYALLVLVVFGVTVAQTADAIDVLNLGGGLFWSLIIFTSLLGLGRSFAVEVEDGALEGILLVPLDRSVIFLAKLSANLLFLLVMELIALPLFFVFFLGGEPLAATAPLALWPLLAGTVGIAGIGTLLATMTVGTRSREVLLTLLFVPLAFPLLYACVAATTMALTGSALLADNYVSTLALAFGYDVIMIAVSWLLYDFVVSA